MALNAAEIRDLITGPPEAFGDRAFAVLASVAALSSRGAQAESRDLLLRLLDRRDALGAGGTLLNALIREHGLFPYLDDPESLGIADQLAYEAHRPLGIDDIVFHAKQAEVYRLLADGRNVVLSAPTSFGKSLIIDAILATGRYRTVVLIVPTIALIDETRRRLTRRFRGQYKIVTQPSQPPGERTVYVLTQERFLDIPAERFAGTDFFAIDEFYKLGAQPTDERSGLLNQAFHRLHATGAQFYLLGPNVDDLARSVRERLQFQFIRTSFETVTLDTEFHPAGKDELRELVTARCATLSGPTVLYASSPARAREIARWLLDARLGRGDSTLDDAASWISRSYHPQWLVARAVRNGIGIHHGRMPRALAHHIVRLFNEGRLPWLIVTSTLIEGVNTIAKNIVIVDNKIGPHKLDFFTYSNICGRSGRMLRHFVGKVIVYGEAPKRETRTVDVPAYSQDKAPLSLLIQLPWNELTAASRQRLQPYYQQQLVSVSTLRAASGIDPEAIVKVARTLHEDPQEWSRRLVWTGWPRYEQLQAACEFIFQLSGGQHHGGVASHDQLATRINLLREHKGEVRPLTDAQMRFAGTKADEAVGDVLDFIREWPFHRFPRLLMILQAVTEDVFTHYGLPAGNYKLYASAVETLFRPPMLTTLEEYGLPAPLSTRLGQFIPLNLSASQIDDVLNRLRSMPRIAGLSSFEEEMLRDTINNL
jgi:DEAD/DEAH box helicase